MDLIGNLLIGFGTAVSPENLLYAFIGAFIGTLIGVLPGVGPTATVAILLPMTFSLEPTTALIMLAGIYYGSQYGGSTTAILINLPGEASSAVTAIDGYQMALQGRGGPALAIAAIGSFFAGSVATLFIALLSVPLTGLALKFGAPDYFALIMLALIASVVLAHGSLLKALAMIAFGILLGTVGMDISSGATRFTFGRVELLEGLDFVAIAVGFFGIAEILKNLEDETTRSVVSRNISSLVPSRSELRASSGPILRGTMLGSFFGILPGGGSVLPAFVSYMTEKKLSRHPERFGKGAIEGVAGPESANNAGAQTSFIPMLTLGIPTNSVMALMLGALIMQGIVPGPTVVTSNPGLFWGVIASMWIGNLMLLILNLPLIGVWVRLLSTPYYILFPAIIAFSLLGVYISSGIVIHVYTILVFGILGYFLLRMGCEPAPLLVGFILGPLLEENFRRSLSLSGGDPMVFLNRPISAALLVLAVCLLVILISPRIYKKREEVFSE